MAQLDTDVDSHIPQEQISDNSPKAPADDHINVGETKDDTASGDVSALHELLKRMEADDEDAGGELNRLRKMLRESHKAHVNSKDPEGVSPLHIAAERGLEKAATVLIEAKANISIEDEESWQPLHYACRKGKHNLAELLLDNKADIEAQGHWQQTPLQTACQKGHSEVANLLLERGANVNSLDDEEFTPLFYAAVWGRHEAVDLLLRKDKSNIDHAVRDDDGWTALHAASYHGYQEVVAMLRKEEAAMGIRDNLGRTPLMLATDKNHADAMRELIFKRKEHEDPHLNDRDKEQDAALTLAAGSGFAEGVRILMDHGADCNIRNKFSRTPIIIASRCRNQDVVLALLQPESRADINAQDQEGLTALHHAACRGHVEVVQLLLNHQADARIPDTKGRHALHGACLQGNVAIVKMLLGVAGQQLKIPDQTGMTPLHVACKAGDEDVFHATIDQLGPQDSIHPEGESPDYISGRHHAVVELLLKSGADPDAKTSVGESVLRLALQSGEQEKLQHLVKYMRVEDEDTPLCSTLKQVNSDKVISDFEGLLNWAAGEFRRHSIAKSLIKKRYASSASSSSECKDGSAIQWAAWTNLAEVLWRLIANSPWDRQTMATIKSLETQKNPLSRWQQKVGEQAQNCDDADPQMEDRLTVRDVIRDPPLGLLCNMHVDSRDFGLPTVDRESYSNLDTLSQLEAAIFQFYKGKSRFGSLRRDRNVQEVIYSKGPQIIIEAMMKKVEKYIEELKPSFTWVHLPSTNMIWMNDLLQAIMKNEGYNASQFRQVKAFLKASWVQVPDKTSESRIMRPRFATKDHVPEAEDETRQTGTEPQRSKAEDGDIRREERGKDKMPKLKERQLGKEKERREGATKDETNREGGLAALRSTAASAIYMPYLSFSTQCAGTDEKGTEETTNHSQPSTHTIKEEGRADFELTRLRHERKNHRRVLTDHESQIIHRSPTLDEWYYHFDHSDPESEKDKDQRNESQVVHKYLPKDAQEQSHWPLIRVNQLWAWTLGNKWLITASSYPIDGNKNALIQGILDHLDKQREAGGSRSQPDTAEEMSKLIVDFCIESYESRPDSPKGLLSIRQMFSKAINFIGRGETMLFKDFGSLIQRWREQIDGKGSQGRRFNKAKYRKSQEKHWIETDHAGLLHGDTDENSEWSGEISADDELRKATKKAQDLSNDIKDIRDELNILKATAQYQQDVQEALYMSHERRRMSQEGGPSPSQKGALMDRIQRIQANLSAAHVVNDIKEMDSVADRIQAAVNTTLSLQQSEIANLQATLSVTQGREAVKQGKTLMVFTVVTILFLPLSFLSSMFALDVASFQQAPGWVFAVMFSVSVAFFIPLAGYAVYSEKFEELWHFVRDAFRTDGGVDEVQLSTEKDKSSSIDRSENEIGETDLPELRSRRQPDEEEGRGLGNGNL